MSKFDFGWNDITVFINGVPVKNVTELKYKRLISATPVNSKSFRRIPRKIKKQLTHAIRALFKR